MQLALGRADDDDAAFAPWPAKEWTGATDQALHDRRRAVLVRNIDLTFLPSPPDQPQRRNEGLQVQGRRSGTARERRLGDRPCSGLVPGNQPLGQLGHAPCRRTASAAGGGPDSAVSQPIKVPPRDFPHTSSLRSREPSCSDVSVCRHVVHTEQRADLAKAQRFRKGWVVMDVVSDVLI